MVEVRGSERLRSNRGKPYEAAWIGQFSSLAISAPQSRRNAQSKRSVPRSCQAVRTMYAHGTSMPSHRHTPDKIGYLRRTVDSSVAMFAVALAIRMVLVQRWTAGMLHRVYETNECARIAWALVSGFGYSSPWPHTPLEATAQQPPVYPLLLAG